ncbi:MAG: toxin-antitoxin system YwqK family antitoxin [Verrucomicrobiales bacterium]
MNFPIRESIRNLIFTCFIVGVLAFLFWMLGGIAIVDENQLAEEGGVCYLIDSGKVFTGVTEGYHPNGQKKHRGKYKNGIRHEVWEWWYPNGQKKREEFYSYGEIAGQCDTWYENGQRKSKANYSLINSRKRGGMEGTINQMSKRAAGNTWVWWHENGQKKMERDYSYGELVEGSEKYWNSKGEPVASWEESQK